MTYSQVNHGKNPSKTRRALEEQLSAQIPTEVSEKLAKLQTLGGIDIQASNMLLQGDLSANKTPPK